MSLHHSTSSAPAVPPIPTSSGVTTSQSPAGYVPGQQQMGSSNVQHNPPQPSTPTAPEKPVFKMRRTGFSGPVPLANPSAPSPLGAGGEGPTKVNPSPLTSSLTKTHTNMVAASGSRSGANRVSLKGGQNVFLMQTASLKEVQRHSDASTENVSRQSSHLQNMPTTDGLDRHHPIELVESDLEMPDLSTPDTRAPAPIQTTTPSGTQPKENAFDDKAYRSWTGTF